MAVLSPAHLKQHSVTLPLLTLSCELLSFAQLLKSHHLFTQKNQRGRTIQEDNVL